MTSQPPASVVSIVTFVKLRAAAWYQKLTAPGRGIVGPVILPLASRTNGAGGLAVLAISVATV